MMKRIVLCNLLTTSAIAVYIGFSTEANADNHNHLYSYDTQYGYIQFYNYDGYWPVVRRIRHNGDWHQCTFWSNRYSCEREPRRDSYGGGHSGGYGGG